MQIGKHSRKLAALRKATKHGNLTSDGLLPIEGPILLEEAQRSGIEIVDVFRKAGAPMPAVEPDAIFDVSEEAFKTVQDTEHPQGIIATVRPLQYTPGAMLGVSPELVIGLSRLQDPGTFRPLLRIRQTSGS